MFTTREDWLNAAIEKLRPRFDATDAVPAEKIHAIVSWPFRSRKSLGQCFGTSWTKDKTIYVTVSPLLGDDPARVLDVLLHEMVHACGIMNHGPDFKKVATRVGLTGNMRATDATPELRADLEILADELGPYPHTVMKNGARTAAPRTKGKGTRLRLVCEDHTEYSVDINRRRFEDGEQIAPLCPHCMGTMVPA